MGEAASVCCTNAQESSSSRFCSVCPFTFGWCNSVCKPSLHPSLPAPPSCSRLLNWLGGNKEYADWFICGSDLGSAPLEKWELLPHSLEVWSSSSRPPHFPLHQSSVFCFPPPSSGVEPSPRLLDGGDESRSRPDQSCLYGAVDVMQLLQASCNEESLLLWEHAGSPDNP